MDGAATDAMEAQAAARSTDSTDCDVDDAEVARRRANGTEPDPKRHRADQVTATDGAGRKKNKRGNSKRKKGGSAQAGRNERQRRL